MPHADILHFLHMTGPVLCLDIGSGTQDVLLARPEMEPENWPRFVLPSPARLVAQRVRALTQLGRSVWLYGRNMGGGFTRALQAHTAAGLAVALSPEAACAVHDSPEMVRSMGFSISHHCPEGAVAVAISDYSPAHWEGLLRQAGLPLPHRVVAAAQDHGIHEAGNRQGRMRHWRGLLDVSPHPADWIYTVPPPNLTRLVALHAVTGGPVADTGTAALLGALCLPEVRDRSQREGVTIVNIGNSHCVAALVYQQRILGIYEHHTGMRSVEQLLQDLQEFRMGWLPDEQVRATGGHGTAFGHIPEAAAGFDPTFVLGPRRELLRGYGQFVAPYGDMMLAGCYGLLEGMAAKFTLAQG
ncbi:MAG: DUF1786 domain-containing protein [Desulfovibrionaceae bacterium]